MSYITIETSTATPRSVDHSIIQELRLIGGADSIFDPDWGRLEGVSHLGANLPQIHTLWRVCLINPHFSSDVETAGASGTAMHVLRNGTLEASFRDIPFRFTASHGWLNLETHTRHRTLADALQPYGRSPLTRSGIVLECVEKMGRPFVLLPTIADVAQIRLEVALSVPVDRSWANFPVWQNAGVTLNQFACICDLVVNVDGYNDAEAIRWPGANVLVKRDGSAFVTAENQALCYKNRCWSAPSMPFADFDTLQELFEALERHDAPQGEPAYDPLKALEDRVFWEVMPDGSEREVFKTGMHIVPVDTMLLGWAVFKIRAHFELWLEEPQDSLNGRVPEFLIQSGEGDHEVFELLKLRPGM